MRIKLLLFLQFSALLGAAITGPGPCPTNTLNIYESFGATGCVIEGFIYKNFSFQTLSASGGAVPILASDVTVTPGFVAANLSVTFTSPGFSLQGSEFVQYLLAYTVDPLPPVIIRFEDDMYAQSPVFPGTADINTDLCIGALFGPLSPCGPGGSPASLSVFHHGTAGTTKLFDEVTFPGTNLVDVRNTITLAANGATSQINGFGNTAGIPEPGAWVLAGSGLFLLLRRRACPKAF
jgi:hypothetical protein